MKTKLFLLSFLAVLCTACDKKGDNISSNSGFDEEKGTSEKVVTVSATEITANNALLTGQIGVEIADYKSIEFGMLISDKESDVSSYEGEKLVGDKLIGTIFSIEAKSLSAETKFYYRAYLVLNNMQYEYGAIKSFKTEKSSGGGGTEGNHEMVDLGLPSGLKWATCNVGATKPEEYGDYFAWGETSPKTEYSWDTYKWCNGTYNSQTKYCTNSVYGTVDNKTTLELEDDAAYVNWGGNWRMPTEKEQIELSVNCTWTWTDNYNNTDVKGYIVSSKAVGNNNSIFLPAAGYYNGTNYRYFNEEGYYWSSSLYSDDACYADYLYFDSGDRGFDGSYRDNGQSVRPVCQ